MPHTLPEALALLPAVKDVQTLQTAHQVLASLHHWLDLGWPCLVLLPLLRPVRTVREGLFLAADRFRDPWSQLLDHPWGRFWPVPAAILPGCIPLVSIWMACAPASHRSITVSALLLAAAVLQIYGQERNNRDRIETAAEIAEQKNLSAKQRSLLLGMFSELRKQSAGVGSIASEVGRLADAISDLAAQAEEEEEEEEGGY